MSFIPICSRCLSEIDGGTRGLLLSCGHFVCHGCCRETQPSTCPHCGLGARAAQLDNPPAEVGDYLQNPSTQFKAANDGVMFQLDHFRAAAKQASKALRDLRLVHSHEMRRREAAEEDAHGWRRRAEAAGAAAASTRDEGDRQDSSGRGGGASSPVGKLKRRFFEAREGGEGAAEAATRASTKPAAPSPFHFERQQAGGGVGGGGDQGGAKGGGARWDQQIPSPALNERPPSSSSITSVATAAGRRPSMDRISRSHPRFTGAHSGQQQHPPRLVSAAAGECYGRVLPSPSS
ncbi:unnamed protein product, partial [Hapterophycus canaliculatus]